MLMECSLIVTISSVTINRTVPGFNFIDILLVLLTASPNPVNIKHMLELFSGRIEISVPPVA